MTAEQPRDLHDSLLNAASVYAEAVHQAQHLDRANGLMNQAIKAEVKSLIEGGHGHEHALRITTDSFKAEVHYMQFAIGKAKHNVGFTKSPFLV